jgi:hypothetical protein
VVLWAIFAVELTGLVTLGVQRSWLIRAARPTLTRAMVAGERRQDRDQRLPLGEVESRQRLQNVALTASGGLALPGAIAVIQSDLSSEWCLPAFFLTGFVGTDVALVMAIVVGLWRGWLPLPDDGDDGGDDDDELAPVPGGPFTRAHVFKLRR